MKEEHTPETALLTLFIEINLISTHMDKIEIKVNDKIYKIVSRKITSKYTRIAKKTTTTKKTVVQGNGGSLFLATG